MDTEEERASRAQVGGHVKGRGQSCAGRRAEGRTRQSAGRAGTNSAHGLWISRSLDEGKGGVIRSRRVGRRAAYRAGQAQGQVRGIPREGRKKKRAQMTE